MTDRISSISDLQRHQKLDPLANVNSNRGLSQDPIQLDFNSALTTIDRPLSEDEIVLYHS
jgi:hypothetical protein